MSKWARVAAGIGGLLVAALCGLHAGEPPSEALPHGGFEAGLGEDRVPVGWERGGCDTPEVCALDAKVKKEGALAFRIGATKPTDCHYCTPVRVTPGALYRVTGWVRTQDYVAVLGAQVRATITVRNKKNGQIIESAMPHEGTTDWVQETVDFIAPGNGLVVVALEYGSWGRSTGTVWFDGLTLARVADPGKVGDLDAPPQGCHARAEWALRRNPPDWAALAGALESYYAQGGSRSAGRIAQYLIALTNAAGADPAARQALSEVYGRHAWRVALTALLGQDLRPLLEAVARDAKRPELASTARLGLARLDAVAGGRPVPEAARAVLDATGDNAATRDVLITTLLGDVRVLQAKAMQERAVRACQVLMAVVPADHPARPKVESAHLAALMAAGDADGARAAGEKLVHPDAKVPPELRREALLALCKLAKDPQQAAEWLAKADELFARNRGQRARFQLDHAGQLAADKRWADAAAACQRITAAYPQELALCFAAQRLTTQALMEQRRFDEALAAAKVLYGAAPNAEKEITDAVNLVMQTLKARHRSIAVANRFVTFQSYGPNGRDGKAGTEDDVADPLAKIQYAPPADVEALFKKTLGSLPDDFAGRRWRGYLHLYWGKPQEALRTFTWRFDNAPLQQKTIDEAIDDVIVGLKAYVGHTLAGEQFMDYQKYGPEGQDGKKGTPDDPRNPLDGLFENE